MYCTEAVRAGAASLDAYPADPDAFPAESYSDRGLERAAMAASAKAFSRMVQPGLTAAAECGNMYAGARLTGQPHSPSTAVTDSGIQGAMGSL